jgi:CheY-like chemotaxis protein
MAILTRRTTPDATTPNPATETAQSAAVATAPSPSPATTPIPAAETTATKPVESLPNTVAETARSTPAAIAPGTAVVTTPGLAALTTSSTPVETAQSTAVVIAPSPAVATTPTAAVATTPGTAVAIAPTTTDKKKILVVDDSKVFLKAISTVLASKGYEVLKAENGSQTITVLRKLKPDLILLDLGFVPDPSNIGGALSNGFVILDWARRMYQAEKIPVIIVSASNSKDHEAHAKSAGVFAYFHKPVDNRKLIEAIHAALGEVPVAA